MGYAKQESITLTTDASGDATGYLGALVGRVVSVQYAKDDYADGVDFTITVEGTSQSIWTDTNINASEVVYPKQLNDDTAGDDLTAVHDPVFLTDQDRVKIVVASGGDAKSGTFTVRVAT